MLKLRRKLHSSKGASSLIALVFFLLCLTVGAVVLTAATVNAGHVSSMRLEEQKRLTVFSAAGLMRDTISGGKLTMTTTEVQGMGSTTSTPSLEITGTDLQDTLKIDAQDLSTGGSPAKRILSIDASAKSGGSLAKVTAELQMENDYSLTVMFYLDEKGEKKNPVTLKLPANKTESTKRSTREVPYDTGMKDAAGNPIIEQYTEITTVKTVIITWLQGAAEKGART